MDLGTWASLIRAAVLSHNPTNVGTLYTPDGRRVEHAAEVLEFRGRDAITGRFHALMTAVPDCALEVRAVHGDDDVRILEWVFAGTHTGPPVEGAVGILATLPPRGEPILVAGVSVCRCEGDLIHAERAYFDSAHLAAPAGAGTPARSAA